jgi:hypothetical protein
LPSKREKKQKYTPSLRNAFDEWGRQASRWVSYDGGAHLHEMRWSECKREEEVR